MQSRTRKLDTPAKRRAHTNKKKHKGKTFQQMSTPDKWELVEFMAKNLGYL